MERKKKAAASGGAHGRRGISLTDKAYCPHERRATQRAKILAHMQRHGSISTADARRQLAVMHPAGRIQELRRAGYLIITQRDRHQRCARYRLVRQGSQGVDDAID